MTAFRAVGLACLLLACSSSAIKPPDSGGLGDAPPAADTAPLTVGSVDAAPEAPGPDLAPPDLAPPDLAPPDLAPDSAPDVAPDALMCAVPADTYGPLANCTPGGTQSCDPVCQARCGCGERCV